MLLAFQGEFFLAPRAGWELSYQMVPNCGSRPEDEVLKVSIIICTLNRAGDLMGTLESLAGVGIPSDICVELIVVDNGSTDDTAAVVKSARITDVQVRYVYESRLGKSHALNSGVKAAESDVLIFCDDDVRFSPDWLERMCRPIASGKADAVAGGIVAAPSLKRDWMEAFHLDWLGTNIDGGGRITFMAGANMAVRQAAMKCTSGFDVELGPGPNALGNAEDTLLAGQLRSRFRVVDAPDARVVHLGQESNLERVALLAAARKRGRSHAYIAYHWGQRVPWRPFLRLVKRSILAGIARGTAVFKPQPVGCVSKRELLLAESIAWCRQYLRERRRPRNYDRHGLIKIRGRRCDSA